MTPEQRLACLSHPQYECTLIARDTNSSLQSVDICSLLLSLVMYARNFVSEVTPTSEVTSIYR